MGMEDAEGGTAVEGWYICMLAGRYQRARTLRSVVCTHPFARNPLSFPFRPSLFIGGDYLQIGRFGDAEPAGSMPAGARCSAIVPVAISRRV